MRAGTAHRADARIDADLGITLDQDLIITDIHYYAISDQVRCRHSIRVDVEVDEDIVASALTHTPVWGDGGDMRPDAQPASTSIALGSGVRVAAGQTLALSAGRFQYVGKWCGDSADANRSLMYTLSGYYAQP